jgi:superfamily I DNA/RNA helicase
MPTPEEVELDAAIAAVLKSNSQKKLVVAGPGAGKTTLFQKLLEQEDGPKDSHLVLTFINNLKNDLERSLGELAAVHTLHGYCQHLLHAHDALRNGLTARFECYPGLVSLIKRDCEWLHSDPAPQFVALMRELDLSAADQEFYLSRSNYYNAVDFDDSVYRVIERLRAVPDDVLAYDLVLIDEFQDFNKMEAAVIAALANENPIIIAGDDDQALYSQLRAASWDHIRDHHNDAEYEVFYLPFCMRCPEVIVSAVNSILEKAAAIGALEGRIAKPYRFFEPVKGSDSRDYPRIDLVRTSVQRGNANYFGKYVERLVNAIPQAHADAAATKNEPLVLIIGSKPYLPQIHAHLIATGLLQDVAEPNISERTDALRMLARDSQSNLGWRIILNTGDQGIARERVVEAAAQSCSLAEVIPPVERDAIIAEALALPPDPPAPTPTTPRIMLTSYEGSKGLSAQYVVLVGLHEDELPRRAADIKDMEICKFLVGLTRTKKKCTLLTTRRFGQDIKNLSCFIGWIPGQSYSRIEVNAQYWR